MASGDSKYALTKAKANNPSMLIKKLVELMEYPVSRNATQRHLQLLNEFLNASSYAFWLRDIPYVIRLYGVIIKKVEQLPEFREPLECLLYFSATPPILCNLSDQITYSRDFQEYFSTLGYLILCLPNENSSKLVLNAIIHLLDQHSLVEGYCCVPYEYITEAVEKSKLPEILAQILQVINDTLYPLMLEATFLICEISVLTCRTAIQQNAIEFLLRRLEPKWRHESNIKLCNPTQNDTIPHVEYTCCILWKLLNAVEKEMIESPTIYALRGLKYALQWSCMAPGHRTDRNSLIAIVLKLLNILPNTDLIKNEFAYDITLLAVSVTGHFGSIQIEYKEDDTDYQFKKIIWACIHFFEKDNINKVITENNTAITLMKYLFENQSGTVNHTQYCSLIKIIIKLIPNMFTVSIDKFLEFDGPFQITRMVNNYLNSPYDIDILYAYIYCIHKCCLLETPDVVQAFGQANIFHIITLVCDNILTTAILIKIHQKCIARSFCLLQIILEAGYGYSDTILDLCINYLNRLVHQDENDYVLDVKVTVCALHFLWDLLADDTINFEFIKKGGIYILLDIVEMCTFPVKSLVLGILVDLSTKASCIPYLITWRRRGVKLLPMLMEIFRGRTEELCTSVEKTQFTFEKPDQKIALCGGPKPTMQCYEINPSEIIRSCRLKINGIIYALKVKFRDKVYLANTHYKIYTEKLNTDDELTMIFAEHFLSLTMCHTWMQLAKELKREEIIPVNSDYELLKDRIYRIRQWRLYLQYKIDKIINYEKQQEKINECETYILLNEARLSNALEGLAELRFVSTCTERMFQLSSKLRLSQEVEPTLEKHNYHRTILNLPFTHIFNQTINIQSDVMYDTKEEECDLAPVSPESHRSLEIEYSHDTLSEYNLEC